MYKMNRLKSIYLPLAILGIVFLSSQALGAVQNPTSQGQFTPLTPFDMKIMSSGVYQILDSGLVTQEPEQIETIFKQSKVFKYLPDGNLDNWQPPSITEKLKTGDCEDLSLWLWSQLVKQGYKNVRLVIGKYDIHEVQWHVWIELRLTPEESIILDPAMQFRIRKSSEFSKTLYSASYSYDAHHKYTHQTD
ncbi:MAG: putative transglutaminase-like cysteine proteinase [Candidatus Omnitrophota bacterium]|jgi:predicted transglutaminase-like cysteine proteinase